MQQHFSTCNATMLRCKLQQFVARITSPDVSSNYPVTKNYRVHFFCEEDKSLSIKKSFFVFPKKCLGASSVALINPPFCGDTFFY